MERDFDLCPWGRRRTDGRNGRVHLFAYTGEASQEIDAIDISDINNDRKNAEHRILDLSFCDGISHDGEVGEEEVVSHPEERSGEVWRDESGLTIFVSAIHGASL